MKKLSVVVLAASLSALGNLFAMTVGDVTVVQRWPWSRLIDVEFVLDCESTERAKITLSAKNGESDLPIPLTAIEGAMVVGPGLNRVTIDPVAAGFPETVMTRFGVTVSAERSPAYMIVDLSTGEKSYNYDWNDFTWYNTDEYKTTKMVFRHIVAGSFLMGSKPNQGPEENDMPPHKVRLTEDYWLAVFETTAKQFRTAGQLDGLDIGETLPIVNVGVWWQVRGNYERARFDPIWYTFCYKVAEKTALKVDLPTEAQWEYACRAGTCAPYYDASIPLYGDQAKTICRCFELTIDDGNRAPWDVGRLLPNAWGLYDMLGNVWEPCYDGYSVPTTMADAVDPVVPPYAVEVSQTYPVVMRGGSYLENLKFNRCGSRSVIDANSNAGNAGCRIMAKYEL